MTCIETYDGRREALREGEAPGEPRRLTAARRAARPPVGRDAGAILLAALGLLILPALPRLAAAQPMSPSARPGESVPMAPANIVQQIGVDQKLDGQVPLDLTFRDETGQTVTLGQYFGKGRPVVLSLVYYECPMLCTMTLNGMTASFKPLEFSVGKEFDVITVSFNPKETPDLAASKKKSYVKSYGRDSAKAGWHFLTGDADNIRKLCQSVGFRYAYDPHTGQYAHASAIMVLTPQGKISRYFYGLEYSARDLRLGLIEASEEKIGTTADEVMLLCFQYDPRSGKYGLAIVNTLKAAALLTMALIGGSIFLMIRRERRAAAKAAAAGPAPVTNDQ